TAIQGVSLGICLFCGMIRASIGVVRFLVAAPFK
ncbi:MAG: hypothetical protein ACJAYG_002576, partial [Oceanicoccus sp.]